MFQDLDAFSHTSIMQETLSERVVCQGTHGILEPRVTQLWSGPPCAHSLLGRQWERHRSSLCQFVSSKTLGLSPEPDHPPPSMGALFFLLLRPEPSHCDSFLSDAALVPTTSHFKFQPPSLPPPLPLDSKASTSQLDHQSHL